MERKISPQELEFFYESVDELCAEIFVKKESELQKKLDEFDNSIST
jgi:hypothetical protein